VSQSRAGVSEHQRRLARLKSSWSHQARHGLDATAILESLDPAVVSRGLDGVINSWNRGAERLYGYSAGEMVGQTFARIASSDRTTDRASISAGPCR
jgi:PAS domain-containing protein